MFDLHTHTLFSDGKNSAEEMVCEAIRLGLKCIGFSDHSGVCYDDCGMTEKTEEEYRAEIRRLKTEYAGRIKILCVLYTHYGWKTGTISVWTGIRTGLQQTY